MNKRSRPVASCIKCGQSEWDSGQINQRCWNRADGRRCEGTYRSMLMENDWQGCPNCEATGIDDKGKCSICNGDGWIYIRME